VSGWSGRSHGLASRRDLLRNGMGSQAGSGCCEQMRQREDRKSLFGQSVRLFSSRECICRLIPIGDALMRFAAIAFVPVIWLLVIALVLQWIVSGFRKPT
jgi:hypothetical protein